MTSDKSHCCMQHAAVLQWCMQHCIQYCCMNQVNDINQWVHLFCIPDDMRKIVNLFLFPGVPGWCGPSGGGLSPAARTSHSPTSPWLSFWSLVTSQAGVKSCNDCFPLDACYFFLEIRNTLSKTGKKCGYHTTNWEFPGIRDWVIEVGVDRLDPNPWPQWLLAPNFT